MTYEQKFNFTPTAVAISLLAGLHTKDVTREQRIGLTYKLEFARSLAQDFVFHFCLKTRLECGGGHARELLDDILGALQADLELRNLSVYCRKFLLNSHLQL